MSTANKEDAKSTRAFVKQLISAINGVTCPLEEPWKTHFDALKSNYNSVLEALPPSDMVPAANEANWNLGSLFSCLMSAQNLVTGMGSAMNGMKTKMEEALSSINSKAEAILSERVKAGELIAKDTHTALCSEARNAGLEEGRKEIRGEQEKAQAAVKVLTERKALLATNGLPMPDKDEWLAGTEEQFTAAQGKAKTRMETLKGKGMALNSKLMGKVWLPDGEYSTFEALASDALSAKGGKGESFATPPEGSGGAGAAKVPRGLM